MIVELADRYDLPELVPTAIGPLRLAAERGVVLTTLWVFLLKRILGVAATTSLIGSSGGSSRTGPVKSDDPS